MERTPFVNAILETTHFTQAPGSPDIRVERLEANLGAEIFGLDLSGPISPQTADLLRSLLWEHQVLFFRDTGVDDARQAEIGRIFGPPQVDSIAKRRGVTPEQIVPMNTGPYANGYYGTRWHADATYLEQPYLVSVLRSVIAPELGGDTAFSSGIAAYESLPDEVKARIEGLTAIHRPDSKARLLITDEAELREYLAEHPGVEHPVVITHPFNGRKVLYVNETFTDEIVGLPEEEGRRLLAYLTHQFYRPENQVRFKWRPGSLAIWDNRSVQHYGVADYGNAQRQLVRVVAQGDRPTR
jgi:taurine dioxygenase